MSLPTVPAGYSNWNAYLKDVPKDQRGLVKCDEIAEPARQSIGTNSYRVLNHFVGSKSPTVGRPWSASPAQAINLLVEDGGDVLETENNDPIILG